MRLLDCSVLYAGVERSPSRAMSYARFCLPLVLLAAACGAEPEDEADVLVDVRGCEAAFVVEDDGDAQSTPLPGAVTMSDGSACAYTANQPDEQPPEEEPPQDQENP